MLCKLGDVEFNAVLEEKPEYNNTITSHAVESGQDVSDHVKVNQNLLNLTGVVSGDDAPQKLATLLDYRQRGKALTYVGRNGFFGAVIQSFTTTHNARIRDGFQFEMTLVQVRIAQIKEVEISSPSIGNTQTKPLQNAGRQQPKEAKTSWGEFKKLEAANQTTSWGEFRRLGG